MTGLTPQNLALVSRLEVFDIGPAYVDIQPADLNRLLDAARDEGRREATATIVSSEILTPSELRALLANGIDQRPIMVPNPPCRTCGGLPVSRMADGHAFGCPEAGQ